MPCYKGAGCLFLKQSTTKVRGRCPGMASSHPGISSSPSPCGTGQERQNRGVPVAACGSALTELVGPCPACGEGGQKGSELGQSWEGFLGSCLPSTDRREMRNVDRARGGQCMGQGRGQCLGLGWGQCTTRAGGAQSLTGTWCQDYDSSSRARDGALVPLSDVKRWDLSGGATQGWGRQLGCGFSVRPDNNTPQKYSSRSIQWGKIRRRKK